MLISVLTGIFNFCATVETEKLVYEYLVWLKGQNGSSFVHVYQLWLSSHVRTADIFLPRTKLFLLGRARTKQKKNDTYMISCICAGIIVKAIRIYRITLLPECSLQGNGKSSRIWLWRQFAHVDPKTRQVPLARRQAREYAPLFTETTATNHQTRLAPVMGAQILQAKTTDCPLSMHCSSRGLRTFYGISRICLLYFSYFVCCVCNRRVLAGRRRAFCSCPGLVAASMLRCSLDCMLACLLVGRQLFTRFTF